MTETTSTDSDDLGTATWVGGDCDCIFDENGFVDDEWEDELCEWCQWALDGFG